MKTAGMVAAAVAVLTLGACIIPVYVDDAGRFTRPVVPFREIVELPEGGAIVIDASIGDIEILGSEGNEVVIEAAEDWWDDTGGGRRSWFPGGNNVVPDIEVRIEDGILRIKARPRDRNLEEDRAVRLILRVPKAVDLRDIAARKGRIVVADVFGRARIDLEDGDVRVENYSGSLDVDVGRGSVRAELLDLRPEDAIRIVLRRGNAVLTLEEGIAARLEADAPNGALTCDFDLEPPVSGGRAAGTIGGGGGPLITVSSRDGDVRIQRMSR